MSIEVWKVVWLLSFGLNKNELELVVETSKIVNKYTAVILHQYK